MARGGLVRSAAEDGTAAERAVPPGDTATRPHRSRPGTGSFCGIARAAALLGDAWTLLLLRDLADGPRRFTELEASTGISPRVLTDRLRSLCDQGLISRHMYPEIPPRVEYELTDKGQAALPVLAALRAYGEEWLLPHETEPTGRCSGDHDA